MAVSIWQLDDVSPHLQATLTTRMAFFPLNVEKGISLPLMSFAASSKKVFGTPFSLSEPDLCTTLPIYPKNYKHLDNLIPPSENIKPPISLSSPTYKPFPHSNPNFIYNCQLGGMQFLEKNEYHTDDPYVKEIINEEIRREMVVNFNQADGDAAGRQKKGKSAHEQNLFNLKNNDGKFKYLWAQGEGIEEIDYQDEENKRKREKDMELVEPPRYKIIGYTTDRGCKLKKRPILRMSDLYLTSNPKIRRLVNRVFDRHIYGRSDPRKGEGDVIISRTASNAHELEEILKNHEGHQQDYNFENQQMQMNEKQLEEYIIDRGQSKQNYFLFYKHEEPKRITYQVTNNPINSEHFLRQLHSEVRQIERKYDRPEECEEIEQEEKQVRKEEEKKVKEYFGQYKIGGREKVSQKFTIEDTFESKVKASEAKANSIIDYYSYVDNEIVEQRYLQGLPDNDKLELNLANPFFFQPKLHTILHREKEFFQENEYRARLAQANKGNKLDVSLLSGYSGRAGGKSKMVSGLGSEGHELNGQRQEDHLSIERVIQTQIKNVYRQPLKHSQVATKYDFVKFTFQEQCFNHLHRFNFAFHQHLGAGRVKVEVAVHKNRKAKPNGLVINSEMKESNDKFSRKEDLSLVRGQFIVIEYIEENPLLMSDVGMCERMMVQVNYLEILEKVKAEAILNKSFEEMEEERDVRRTAQAMSFQKHCDLWRKCIKDTFGENGKQFFWEPKNNGKLIGIPEGPGVLLMESNLCNVPIVRKKPNRREFLLVREGKRWVIRRIESLYVSGQIEPHKKVFCPGSRTHTEFKSAYEKAFIVKQIKEYGSVNFDQLKLAFKGETENSLRRALKNANTISKDSKLYRQASQEVRMNENELTPQEIVLYQRMQRSLCELREAGITEIKTNEKMKNVLKQFNRKHFTNQQKITIARMIREQLQLTSWYLTESFLKYKLKTSKIEINGFADPTNGRGGYSYINKPQKERTSKEDMEDRAEKSRNSTLQDLRKLKVDDSKERLRAMGHNEDEIDFKGRWQLINLLKNKEGTQFSRRQRQTKNKKIENQKKEINRNFNRLLAYLNDQTEQPAFDYARQKRNKLEDYMQREREYFNKINRKYGKPQQTSEVKEDNRSDDSDEDD